MTLMTWAKVKTTPCTRPMVVAPHLMTAQVSMTKYHIIIGNYYEDSTIILSLSSKV